jgi:glutathionylspermidine synthase
MFPHHPNLLAAFFEDDQRAAELGASSFVRKPLYSREGANVALISEAAPLAEREGPYGEEGFVRQALANLRKFSGQFPVVGRWLVHHTPCGLSIPRMKTRSPATARASCPHRTQLKPLKSVPALTRGSCEAS